MTTPIDWDGESFCTKDDCHAPAMHPVLIGMVDDTPLYELVCCTHASGRIIPRAFVGVLDRYETENA